MNQKTLRITRVNRDRLKVEHIRNGMFHPIGHSYSLERFLAKIKRKGAEIQRTGYGGLAYVIASEKLIAIWDSRNVQINVPFEADC